MTMILSPEAAKALGFAEFNGGPHLCVDVPDGMSTITARTSDGRRITFAFLEYEKGKPPQAVDIQYHDNGTVRFNGHNRIPTYDVLVFNGPHGFLLDSRKLPVDQKPGITCILMETKKEA
jgi:hypothetical protein